MSSIMNTKNLDPHEKIKMMKIHYSYFSGPRLARKKNNYKTYFTTFRISEPNNDDTSPIQRSDIYKTPDLSSYIFFYRNWNVYSFVQSKTENVLKTCNTKYQNDWSETKFQKTQTNTNKNPNNVTNALNQMLAKPTDISKGKSMLEKMGWKGGSLGKHGGGILEPITPEATYASATFGLGHGSHYKEPEEDEFNENFRTNILLIILNFVRNEHQTHIRFDNTFLKNERKRIHHIVVDLREAKSEYDIDYDKELDISIAKNILESNPYSLFTQSWGNGKRRQITIFKDAPDHMYLIIPADLRVNEIEESYNEIVSYKNKNISQNNKKPVMKKGQNKNKKNKDGKEPKSDPEPLSETNNKLEKNEIITSKAQYKNFDKTYNVNDLVIEDNNKVVNKSQNNINIENNNVTEEISQNYEKQYENIKIIDEVISKDTAEHINSVQNKECEITENNCELLEKNKINVIKRTQNNNKQIEGGNVIDEKSYTKNINVVSGKKLILEPTQNDTIQNKGDEISKEENGNALEVSKKSNCVNKTTDLLHKTSNKINEVTKKSAEEVLSIVIGIFKEFIAAIPFTELRFLGTFNEEEREAIQIFFGVFFNKHDSKINNELSELINNAEYEFIVKKYIYVNNTIEKRKKGESKK